MVRHSSLTVSANSRHMALCLTSAFWEILMFQQLRNSPLRDLPYPWYRPPSAAAAPAGRSSCQFPVRILDIDFAGRTAKSHRGEMKIELTKPRIANRSGDTWLWPFAPIAICRLLEAERTSSEVQWGVRRVSA